MNRILATMLAAAVVATALIPLAGAAENRGPANYTVNTCVIARCAHTETDTVTNTQTCGGSGNVVFVVGNENDVNICKQDQ